MVEYVADYFPAGYGDVVDIGPREQRRKANPSTTITIPAATVSGYHASQPLTANKQSTLKQPKHQTNAVKQIHQK